MKITALSVQAHNPDRLNVSVDGKYRFSLDIFQISELGIRVDKEYSEEELQSFQDESVFGKLYGRALEYTMLRPHSAKEVRDYLWKRTRDTKFRSKKTGEWQTRAGVGQDVADRVYNRLVKKGYIDDEKFARWWVENRHMQKGTSRRKLHNELRAKGVDTGVIEEIMQNSPRDEKSELHKMIAKKRTRYADEQKLIAYLVRQGFSYDEVKSAVQERD